MNTMSFALLLSAIFLQPGIGFNDAPRTIFIFGSKEHLLVQQQWQLLQKHSSGLAERDVELKFVEPCNNLYKTHNVPPGNAFTVVLIGKDGGEKFRAGKPTQAEEFFALIDAMPMRRAEMRRKKKDQ